MIAAVLGAEPLGTITALALAGCGLASAVSAGRDIARAARVPRHRKHGPR